MWPFGKSTADRVKDAFKAQTLLAGLNLDVRVDNATAFVTGQVPSNQYLGLIKVVATGISGVKDVDTSGLLFDAPAAQAAPAAPDVSVDASSDTSASEVSPDQSSPDQSNQGPTQGQYDQQQGDALVAQALAEHNRIAKGVWNAIQSNGELKDNPIDVLQSGSSIILRGAVDSEHELHLAAQLARSVDGVEAVDASDLKVVGGAKELTKEKDAGGETVYTVQSGDNLSSIALKYFGDAGKYRDLAHYNNISNPDLLQVGQKLRIPG